MDESRAIYTKLAYRTSQQLTQAYSTSFSLASQLFGSGIRQDIYNIYGLVRLADEIVDTERGPKAQQLLNQLEDATYQAIHDKYSPNLILHAFAITANTYGIKKSLIAPFFNSMRFDTHKQTKPLTVTEYQQYIYGSAAVVGLMCLRVFCSVNEKLYRELESGAQALGDAFQKVNFLRDMAADYRDLGRFYFPNTNYDQFDEPMKNQIIADIRQDFNVARKEITKLPANSKPAVLVAYKNYLQLTNKLAATPVHDLKRKRVRVNDGYKMWVLLSRGLPAKIISRGHSV